MILRYILALFMVLSFASYAWAEGPAPEVFEAAKKGLEQFRRLVTEKNYKELGFENPEETLKTVLGEPVREFIVRLDELKEYRPGDDPMKLLKGGDEYIYPVTVGGGVRASVIVAKTDDTWKAISFGSPNTVRLIEKTIKESSSEALPRSAFFVVRVPALYYLFLGYSDSGKLMLIPMMDDIKSDLKAGVAVTAEKAFGPISRLAKEYRYPGK